MQTVLVDKRSSVTLECVQIKWGTESCAIYCVTSKQEGWRVYKLTLGVVRSSVWRPNTSGWSVTLWLDSPWRENFELSEGMHWVLNMLCVTNRTTNMVRNYMVGEKKSIWHYHRNQHSFKMTMTQNNNLTRTQTWQVMCSLGLNIRWK